MRKGQPPLRGRVLKGLVLGALVWVVSVACGGGQGQLFVFAASSLTNVMEELGDEYRAQTGMKVRFSFGASRSLAQQIVRGAPADVFVAAGVHPMDFLEERDLLAEGTRRDLLANRLVVVAEAGNGSAITSLQELLEGDLRVAIADPELAPAGRYAREALVNLGLWDELKSRTVFGTNVRTTLAFVESGNVGAALVYLTDAAITDRVRTVLALPEGSHAPIRYPGAVVKDSERPTEAEGFLAFLASEGAAAIFSRHGFTPLSVP